MPLNFVGSLAVEGKAAIPYYDHVKVWVPGLALLAGVKWYFGGSKNTWNRDLHGRVILITGGTSGLGAAFTRDMAARGAQIVLLVRKLNDSWLHEFISDLRDEMDNPLIFAEEVDLADLYSVRKFATKWLDNMPPRRLDMIVCCAAVARPPSTLRAATVDGIEEQMQVNYLGHYHLLTLLAPAVRSQPPDRDVRIILVSCVSAVMGDIQLADLSFNERFYNRWTPHIVHGTSKLCLALLGYQYQTMMNNYERKDKAPANVHVVVVDPGFMRSPSFKRFFSLGSLWGLLVYVLLWPIWWLFLKSSTEGVQSLLFAAMSPEIAQNPNVSYVSEVRVRTAPPPRKEFRDAQFQQTLFDKAQEVVIDAEKKTLVERKKRNPEKEEADKGSSRPRNKTPSNPPAT